MSEEKPWIRGNLRITREAMKAIEEEALRTYPAEACGFVAGPASDPLLLDETIHEVNEADKYHKLDPETFPRTSRTYFKLNELRASRRFEEGEKNGRPIKVIYHSHTDTTAHFSDEDAYTFALDGQLMWPCAFIVVSVVDGEVKERRLHVHRPGTNEFDESTLEIL